MQRYLVITKAAFSYYTNLYSPSVWKNKPLFEISFDRIVDISIVDLSATNVLSFAITYADYNFEVLEIQFCGTEFQEVGNFYKVFKFILNWHKQKC